MTELLIYDYKSEFPACQVLLWREPPLFCIHFKGVKYVSEEENKPDIV